MNLATAIILLVIALYVIQITLWLHYWRNLPSFQPPEYSYVPVSIVVAFRNESDNMGRLLECIKNQNYPSHLFEVILVDDHSDDGSSEIAAMMLKGIHNFKCIKNHQQPGKKGALITGIAAADNELIITTDADAYLSPAWLAVTSSFYNIHEPSLVISPVNINSGKSFVQRFFAADFISLIASGACAAAGQKPIFCNGANLAFRKSAFLKCADAMNSLAVSGDDTFLLHAMKRNNEKILFLKSTDATVEVKTPANIREFMNQHIRWASKTRHYSDRDTLFTAFIIFLTNISLIAAFFMAVTGINLWLFALMFLLKGLADYRLLSTFYGYLHQTMRVKDFLLFQVIYPIYVVITAISGIFMGYTWKGRHY